jgi:hypothetical protein
LVSQTTIYIQSEPLSDQSTIPNLTGEIGQPYDNIFDAINRAYELGAD